MSRPTNTQFAVAVHVLTYLAGSETDATVSSDELAESANVNPVYVRRVLGPLRTAGFVTSRPGVKGGWQLDRPAGDVTLGDVWRTLQGDDPVLGLHGPNPQCPVGRDVQRALTDLDRQVAAAVEAQLDRSSLLDVLDRATAAAHSDPSRRRPV
jgi:Rrf2 family protein